MVNDPHKVLVVEDDDIDAMAVERSFRRAYPEATLIRAHNGKEALDILQQDSMIDLILMDIRMPVLDGREALREIKTDPHLKKIPVVMTSTSSDKNDITYCYENHANGYVVKPNGIKATDQIIENIIQFWLRSCVVPHRHLPV
jgi:CheY-like chemotaxis protein